MIKCFKFRTYPSKEIKLILNNQFELCRQLYNTALEQRILAYKRDKKQISYCNQQNELPDLKKTFVEFNSVFAQTLRDPLLRLDKAYKSFFRRAKKGEKSGFPRFKSFNRYDSLTYLQYPEGVKLEDRFIILSKIGKIKIKRTRKIEGKIKTVTIKKSSSNKYYIIFSCSEVPKRILPKTNKSIGIDLGITSFLTDSNGNKVANPRLFNKSKLVLAKRQQKLSKLKKGTNRRKKQKLLVAKAYEHLSNQRIDFQFKTARNLVSNFDNIFVEDLDIVSMKGNTSLNRNISDVSWNSFLNKLVFKAEEAGKQVIKVNPRNTSKTCSNCGFINDLDLSQRVFKCKICNFTIDRDHNGAINTYRLGMSLVSKETEISIFGLK